MLERSEASHKKSKLVIPTERSDEGSQKPRMIEILRFAQKRSSPPEGAKGNDNFMKSVILCVMLERSEASHKKVSLSSRQSTATRDLKNRE